MSYISENYLNIQRSIVMKADEILFNNITKIIELRKEIALRFNLCTDEQYKILQDEYDFCNNKLKELLAIPEITDMGRK